MDQPLNILFVSDVSISNGTGGAERVLYEQSQRLAKRGHNVNILTRKQPENDSQIEVIEGVREWRFDLTDLTIRHLLKSTFCECRRLFGYLQNKFSFHILNFHQPFTALGVRSTRASRGLPTVYTCHSLSFEEFVSRSSPPQNVKQWTRHQLQLVARMLTEKTLLKKSNLITVLSEYTRNKIRETYGVPRSKIEVIPGGVDLDRFGPSRNRTAIRRQLNIAEDCLVLLTIRNLVPRMGLENLVVALKAVAEKRKDVLLVLGGEGPLAKELQEKAREAEVSDFISFAGYIPEEELPSYYQMADLFILPTKELEGFGMVTLEALASGLPVLGTPVGGTTEILAHLGPEFLFTDSTPDSMVKLITVTLETWAQEPEAYHQLSRKCRKVAEDYYSWDRHISSLENIFMFTAHQANQSSPYIS